VISKLTIKLQKPHRDVRKYIAVCFAHKKEKTTATCGAETDTAKPRQRISFLH
jgi:hypothetical protein